MITFVFTPHVYNEIIKLGYAGEIANSFAIRHSPTQFADLNNVDRA